VLWLFLSPLLLLLFLSRLGWSHHYTPVNDRQWLLPVISTEISQPRRTSFQNPPKWVPKKNTASISESNQFRTKFYPRLFIFTTMDMIRRRRSKSFLFLFNPRWMKLMTFQKHTSRDFFFWLASVCGSWRRHQKPFSLCILVTCSSNAGSIDFCSNNLSVYLSVPLSFCAYFSMHPF